MSSEKRYHRLPAEAKPMEMSLVSAAGKEQNEHKMDNIFIPELYALTNQVDHGLAAWVNISNIITFWLVTGHLTLRYACHKCV